MLFNYLKITVRSLLKNKIFLITNVLGLGIALSFSIVAYLNYDFNVKYDVQHENASSIYRVNMIHDFPTYSRNYGIAPMPLGAAVRENIGGLKNVIRYSPGSSNIRIGEEVFNTSISSADEAFLDVFTFPLKYGTASDFADKTKIFISDQLSVKYYGEGNPVGNQLTVIREDGNIELTVGGVFEKMPQNSSFQFEAVTNYENYIELFDVDADNWKIWNTTFIQVEDPQALAQITSQLQNYVEIQNKAREDFEIREYYLDPFVGMAIRSEREDIGGHQFRQSLPTAAAIAPGIMAILILLLACFNFTNTSIAIANRRLKEIGIRKAMGSSKQQLVIQFMGENIMLCAVALIVALLLAEYLVPAYSEMWSFVDIHLNYFENSGLIIFLIVLLFGTGIIAGSYPALYVSSFNATSILRGTLKYGGNSAFTKVLLVFQYMIALTSIVSGAAFVQNAQFQKNLNMGFDKEGVIYARVDSEEDYNAYSNLVRQNPDVVHMAGSDHQILSSLYSDPVKYNEAEREALIMDVGDNYFTTMGMEIIEGRDFQMDSENDRLESIIVNETFLKELSISDPLGARIVMRDTVQLFIVGVVRDFYISGFWDTIDPMMIRYTAKENYHHLIVSAKPENVVALYEQMREDWKGVFPDKLYTAEYLEEELAEAEEVNGNILIMFIILGLVATILSATGLYTMVSLNIIKRMKEIGVRKVLGASIGHIIRVVNMQFVIMLSISAILGSVLGYYMADMLMASIWAYYEGVNMIAILISVGLMFFISGAAISFKVYAASSTNPVNTLRVE